MYSLEDLAVTTLVYEVPVPTIWMALHNCPNSFPAGSTSIAEEIAKIFVISGFSI
jgi:hypothetical protein